MNDRNSTPAPAGLLRQLGAAVYDGLLIAAVFMVVTFVVLRLSGYDPMQSKAGLWAQLLHQLVLVVALVAYFGHAWTRRGQTLGMKAWKVSLVRTDRETITWRTACIRLAVAAPLWLTALAGMLWYMPSHQATALWALAPQAVSLLLLYTPLKRTLPDLMSGTCMVRD
jgi:uncharacterized RDD family membrane protein YckC